MTFNNFARSGQSLIEVLVAIAVGAILFIGSATLIAPTLQITKTTSQAQVAAALGDELLNNVRVFSEGNWQNISNLSTSSASYYLITSSSPFTATSGIQSLSISSTTYKRYFSLSSMYRDGSGNATTSASGTTYDPSTEAVAVTYDWTRGTTTTITEYLTRNRTNVYDQTDWSGGSGWNGPATTTNNQFSASTRIIYSIPGQLSAQLPTSTSYTYYRTITIASSSVSSTLTNFPMLVSSTLSSWEPIARGGTIQNVITAPNGGQEPADLIFATSTACAGSLNFETESYVSSTGALVDWVQVPSLSSATNTIIYACYDDGLTTTDQSRPSSTWNSNYALVAHFPAPTGTLSGMDSTANGNNGTNNGATAVTGLIDGGASSTNSNINFGTGSSLNMTSAVTASAWVKVHAYSGGYQGVFGKRSYGGNATNYAINYNGPTGWQWYFNNGSGYQVQPISYTFATGTWYDVVGTFAPNGGNTTANFYVNGLLVSGPTTLTGSIATNTLSLVFGDDAIPTGNEPSDISGDEFRIQSVAETSQQVLTEYNNQNSPSTFYTVGAATLVGPSAGTISTSTTQHWAWNDSLGWIDFYNGNNVSVGASQLTGYASSSAGDISLDCATTRNGNICGQSNYQVLNDGSGSLSGWAWNDTVGWISFCGGSNTSACPGAISYQTNIDASGNFQGWAWNDAVGWIDFNCDNTGGCGTSNYEVKTTWIPASSSTIGSLDSATFDTGVASGSQFNSILWQGTQFGGSTVQFQFAVSNASSGPWSFVGSDGTSNTYFTPSAPGSSVSLGYSAFNNYRYFRYRVYILGTSSSSQINDVIVNWSP